MIEEARTGTCVFCERLRDPSSWKGVPIFEDPLVHVSHPVDADGPSYLGVILIQTKRHTEAGLSSLTDEEGARIGTLVAQISRGLREETGASWTYTYCFTEGFRHVHQFVVARYPETPVEFVRLKVDEWPGAPRGDLEAVRRLAAALALAMAGPPLP